MPVWPLKVNVAVGEPWQIVPLLLTAPPTVVGFTVTATVLLVIQLTGDVAETVYVVLDVGLAVTDAPVVALNPVAGDHV